MALLDVSALLVLVIAACIYVLHSNDLEWESINHSLLSTSKFEQIDSWTLGCIRLFFCIVVWAVASYLYLDPSGLDLNLLMRDGSTKPVHLHSTERFVMFTVWSWLIQGIYFAVAALYCFSKYYSIPFLDNYLLISATWVLFEVSFPISFMVSAVVTYVLIPVAKKQKISAAHFYYPASLLMHNANVIFMSLELVLNQLHFVTVHFPFILFYGIIYIIFSWILYEFKGVYYYFFLDPERKGAIFWYIGLIAGISVFFWFGVGISYLIVEYSEFYAPKMALLAITLSVLKLRP